MSLWGLCLLSFLFFVGYAVSREGRDEHGRAILGSACFYGAIALFIAMNIFTQFTYTVTSNVIIFTNSIRLVFLAFFLLVDIMGAGFAKNTVTVSIAKCSWRMLCNIFF